MTRVSVAAICGNSTVSRQDGALLRNAIELAWAEGPVVIDFNNRRIASVSFFDESLGLLARRLPVQELAARVRVENIGAADRALLNKIVLQRANERSAT
jgi:hypothetical protein